MPRYEFRCTVCNLRSERAAPVRKLPELQAERCKACGGELSQVIHAPGLKADGAYSFNDR